MRSRGAPAHQPSGPAVWTGTRPQVTGAPVVIGAVTIAAVLAGTIVSLMRQPGLPAQISMDYMNAAAGLLAPAVRTSDPDVLGRSLSDGGLGFSPHVASLAPAFELLGGRRHELGGRPSAVWFYGSPARDLAIVEAFRGDLGELGPPDDVRDAGGPRVVLFRKITQTIVCWPEAPAVYCFSSTLPTEHVVELARRHALRATR